MNPIQPWVQRLGWTLVHFLWQGSLIAAVYAAARSAFTRTPNARYLLACAALASMMVAPLATWRMMAPQSRAAEPVNRTAIIPFAESTAVIAPAAVRGVVADARSAQVLQWIVIAWLLGTVAFGIRLIGGWIVAARWRSTSVRLAPDEWQRALGRLASRISLTRPVQLLVSALVHVPTVVGWLRPVILVPVGALSGLPGDQVEMLLLHELAHIRRHDFLVNIVQSVVETLLFYHPAVWWIGGHMRNEREACCDDLAVMASGDVFTYASALAELELRRPARCTPTVAANGGSLADRIARLLGTSRPVARSGFASAVVLTVILALAAYGLYAQSEEKAAFEVASIKPDTANPDMYTVRQLPGGNLHAINAPVMVLIASAYKVQLYQVVGGPPWIEREGFDIDAKAGQPMDDKHVRLALQTLLTDRFKLAMHRETRDLPVLALTATKGGIKVQTPKEGGCIAPDATGPPRFDGKPPCGTIRTVFAGEGAMLMEGSKVPVAVLVQTLAGLIGRPVIDRSGFTGELEVSVKFQPDESTNGALHPGGTRGFGPPPSESNVPRIFAAVQEQLGLKLETSKGPVEVFVIDHVERPTTN